MKVGGVGPVDSKRNSIQKIFRMDKNFLLTFIAGIHIRLHQCCGGDLNSGD